LGGAQRAAEGLLGLRAVVGAVVYRAEAAAKAQALRAQEPGSAARLSSCCWRLLAGRGRQWCESLIASAAYALLPRALVRFLE
jgi:hypothetical protein